MDNWDDIRFFLAISRSGSLKAAAQQMDVDQSTVFRRLRALETSLSTHLFDRRQHGKYVLTDAGIALLKQATRIESATFDIEREVQGSDQQYSGTLRVTTAEDIAVTLLPPLLLKFSRNYPQIHVEVLADNRYYHLGRGEADVAIRPGVGSEEDRVIPRKVRRMYFGLFASKDYLALHENPKMQSDLQQHVVIRWTDSKTGNDISQFLAGVTHPESGPASNNLLAQRAMAEGGLGIACLPEFFGNMSHTLVRLLPKLRIGSGNLWILHHDDMRNNARVRAFVEFMFDALQSEPNLPAG